MRSFNLLIVLSFLAVLTLLAAAPARAVDWAGIPSEKVVFFYPGVASWEFLSGDDHRLGGRDIKRRRKQCRHCHLSREGELDLKADEIAAGTLKMRRSRRPFEPEPVLGKKGTMTGRVQAAYDSGHLYIRVVWESKGEGWKAAPGEGRPPDRVSLQLNKGDSSFRKYGCSITCHNDLTSMPGAPAPGRVRANPYYSRLGRKDVRLYAFYARDGWDRPKARGELERLASRGWLIDLLSIELAGGSAKARDGWILEDRRWEKGGGFEGSGRWEGGFYTAVFKRRLGLKNTRDLAIKEGDVVHVAIAIHDEASEKRKHYISFPFSIGLGTDGDVRAVKLTAGGPDD